VMSLYVCSLDDGTSPRMSESSLFTDVSMSNTRSGLVLPNANAIEQATVLVPTPPLRALTSITFMRYPFQVWQLLPTTMYHDEYRLPNSYLLSFFRPTERPFCFLIYLSPPRCLLSHPLGEKPRFAVFLPGLSAKSARGGVRDTRQIGGKHGELKSYLLRVKACETVARE
jgi:hypothetical protein